MAPTWLPKRKKHIKTTIIGCQKVLLVMAVLYIFFFSVNTVVEHFGFLILPDVSVNKNGHVSPLDMETPGKTQTGWVT